MLPRYYLNDYFPLIDSPLLKEKEYMKTDIREYQNKYIMEIDLPGLKKEDIIAGLCYAIVNNYLNNVGKGKKIVAPIVFQGGVSKNIGVVKAFEDITGEKIYVDNNSHLMGALGVAILSKKQKEIEFSFDIEDVIYETKGTECRGCSNNCEIIEVLRDKRVIDAWGNRCPKGELVHK